jgi:bifunctional non-homologous end joining protein LigD
MYRDVQLATLVKEPPTGEWTYELKFDGYRILALKAGTRVRLMSRRGQDWTEEFSSIARDVAELSRSTFVVDGEVCALDERGIPSFQLLQKRSAPGTRLAYFVFDLLCDDGDDIRASPIEERRDRLTAMMQAGRPPPSITLSKAVAASPTLVLELARRAGLEGVVAKQKGSAYVGGRTRTWLKIKCSNRQEFAIVGWLPLLKSQPLVGSLILGLMQDDGHFHFAGKVGTGFDQQSRKTLHDLLSADASKTPTALDVPRFGGLVRFVVPRHVAEVSFTEWTAGGHVRHPSFQGLRRDKRPQECVRETPRTSEG